MPSEEYAKEQATKKQQREDFKKKIVEVGQILGYTLQESEYDSWFIGYLVNDEGHKISVTLDWRNYDRAEVAGDYPSSLPYNEKRAEIGFASSKTAQQIANDIKRRFLPKYVPTFETTKQYAINIANAEALRDERAQFLAGILGKEVSDRRPYDKSAREIRLGDGTNFYGEFEVGTSSVKLELRMLTIDQANQLAEVIAQITKEAL